MATEVIDTFCEALGFTEEVSTQRQENKTNITPPSQVIRILVAEDNATNQLVIKGMLKKLGYDCTLVENGVQAVEQATSENQFDAILMDCEMPEMDGWQATQTIRTSDPSLASIPIIALTAHAVPEIIQKCFDAGMDAHLSKPLNAKKLDLKIQEVIKS